MCSYRETLHRLASEMCLVQPLGSKSHSTAALRDKDTTDDGSPTRLLDADDSSGLSLEHLCWLEASLWGLIRIQLDHFGGMIDPEAVAEAVDVVESGERRL